MRNSVAILFGLINGGPAVAATEFQWVEDDVVQQAKKAVVEVVVDDNQRSASGFYASASGLVVTSATALEGAKSVTVKTISGDTIKGVQLVAIEKDRDFAVLRTSKTADAWLKCGDVKLADFGEATIALGLSAGKPVTAHAKLLCKRMGESSSGARLVDVWSLCVGRRTVGLTGGPILNAAGNPIGMYSTVAGQIAYAVPASYIATALAGQMNTKPFPIIGEISGTAEIAADPDYVAAMQAMSGGDLDQAVTRLRSAIKRHPHPGALGQLAFALNQMGNIPAAIAACREALMLPNASLRVRVNLADFLATSEPDESLAISEELSRKYPGYAEGWGVYAKLLGMRERHADAVQAAKRAVDAAPDQPMNWVVYAVALTETQQLEEAAKAKDRERELESLFFKMKYLPAAR